MANTSTASTSMSLSPFSVKDCALVALGTGKKAQFLPEFRNRLEDIPTACIYHHFWGGLLQARFEEREYNNDFAAWARHGIHDPILAERLAVLDPTSVSDLETLRHEVIELVDTRLDEEEYLAAIRAKRPFVFVRSQIVVFDTGWRLHTPEELPRAIAKLSTSSVFYHFIDARRRTDDGRDDFSDWLSAFGNDYLKLQQDLADLDPYFGSLGELRQSLANVFARHFAGASA